MSSRVVTDISSQYISSSSTEYNYWFFIQMTPDSISFFFTHSCLGVSHRKVTLVPLIVKPRCCLKLSSTSPLCPVGVGVLRDCAKLTLVTAWHCMFDCGSFEWISRDKALVPARGSCSGSVCSVISQTNPIATAKNAMASASVPCDPHVDLDLTGLTSMSTPHLVCGQLFLWTRRWHHGLFVGPT